MEFAEITCPTCCETFGVAVPPASEMPAEVDYDCEICCRPLIILFNSPDDIRAQGLGD